MQTKLNKTGKIAVKTTAISFILIVLSRIVMELLFNFQLNKTSAEVVYSICYIVIFASLFLGSFSLLIIITLIFKKPKNILTVKP
jgi:hypothetical protein